MAHTSRAANPNLVLNTILRRVRFYLDEPENDKYSDNDLLDLVISPAIQEVWGYLHNTADNPIIASFTLNVVSGTAEYKLPPSVQNVWSIILLDSTGNQVTEIRPRGKFHRRGPDWYLKGDKLVFDPIPDMTQTYTVRYTPTPDQPPHYATDGYLFSDLKTIALSSSPSIGFVDKRVNGYVGAVVRVIGSNSIQTRIISAHTPNTEAPEASSSSQTSDLVERNLIVCDDALDGEFSGQETVAYEIFPVGSQAFTETVALGAVLKLGAARSISQSRYRLFMDQYRHARRTEAQRLTNMMARRGKHVEKLTDDNPEVGLQNLFGAWWAP